MIRYRQYGMIKMFSYLQSGGGLGQVIILAQPVYTTRKQPWLYSTLLPCARRALSFSKLMDNWYSRTYRLDNLSQRPITFRMFHLF